MKNQYLQLRREGFVAWVTLDRPSAGNAINQEFAEELRAVVEKLDADPGCHVLMFTANGKLFCAGGDVAAMVSADDQADYLAMLATTLHDALLTLAESQMIVIAVVDGAAAGAGLGIVLNADLVLASSRAVFLSAYAGVGLTPDCGVSRLLPAVVGPRRAFELITTGRVLGAEEALDWGLVNYVVAEDALEARAQKLAQQLADGPEHVFGGTKLLLHKNRSDYRTHLDDEVQSLREMITQPYAQTNMVAFAQRTAFK